MNSQLVLLIVKAATYFGNDIKTALIMDQVLCFLEKEKALAEEGQWCNGKEGTMFFHNKLLLLMVMFT